MDAIEKRVFAILFGVAIIIAAVVSFKLYFANIALDSATEKVDRLTGEKQLLQSNLTDVSDRLEASEKEKKLLIATQRLTSSTLAKREAEKHKIESDLTATKQKLTEVISNATDQHTKDWAADTVPDAVNQLLKQRTYCADRSHRKTEICISARVADR